MIDSNFGNLIYDGKMIDLKKSEENELESVINDLQKDQIRIKNNIRTILDKMDEEI